VLTAGSAGAFAINPEGQFYRQAAIPADEVERLGRGDAFSAGFLSATLRGLKLPTALRWASLAAAIKSSIPGDLPVWDVSLFDALMSKEAEASPQVER
jgi:2-dehydro-3-deoxygluconokinase